MVFGLNIFFLLALMTTVTSVNVNGLRDRGKLRSLLNIYRSDILCIQETNWDDVKVIEVKEVWGGEIYYNNGAKNARGVAIMIKKHRVDEIKEIYKDRTGRIIVIEFKYQNVLFRLINIYVPNIEIDKRIIIEELKGLVIGRCIIVGDFNTKCSRLDIGQGVVFRWEKSRESLLDMMKDKNLVDVWRNENPERREFTRRQMRDGVLKQSRIDLVLTQGENIKHVDRIRHEINALSDHDGVRFRIKVGREEIGGGMWILNAGYIEEDEYKQQIRELLDMENEKIKEYVEENRADTQIGEIWEKVKNKIKSISIWYSKKRKVKMMKKEKELRERLRVELSKAENEEGYSMENYIEVKMELQRYEAEKCRGAILRSKAKYALEGERCTAYFLGLEKSKQSRTYIHEIRKKEGEVVADYVAILERVQEFYGELYQRGGLEEDSIVEVLDSVESKLSVDDSKWCDREISRMEVMEAIEGLKSGKSPGSDGIGIEFYKVYKEQMASILVEVFRETEKTGIVQGRMVEGVITLVFKKKGSKLDLQNYRPISLLNVDYKILAKVLANRIKRVIGDIIKTSQSYSIPGRDIADTIATVRDTIEFMKRDGTGGIVLAIDWNKAFDRVEHEFLFRLLVRFGFGERLVGWVRRLYEGARSCVKVNGVLTDRFCLGRSIRQGCPLSALLYAISAEPLALLIKNDARVQGIQLPSGSIHTINQYADDTTITVRDGNSVKRVLELAEIYGRASGARINKEKSEIMYIGNIEREGVGLRVQDRYIKVLGIYLGVETKEATETTWTGVINKIKTVCGRWKARKLRLKGKVTVVNSLLLSGYVYVLSVLEMPIWVKNDLNKIVCDFIWEGKGVKIAHGTLVGKRCEGGLNLLDIETKKTALRIKTVKKYIVGGYKYGWKDFMEKYMNDVGGIGQYVWYMGLKQSMTITIPEFYREVFEAWRKFLPKMQYECERILPLVKLPLFLNEKIKHNGKTLYERKFIEGGIRQIKDIIYEVIPGFLRNNCIYDQVCDLEGMDNREKINKIYEKIKTSIPLEWARIIQSECVVKGETSMPELYVMENGKKIKMGEMSVKKVYRWLIVDVMKEPAAEKVWSRVFVGLNVKKIWSNMGIRYNSIECENNDFLIRHNRIYTNVVLNKINNDVNVMCDVCKSGHESFLHYFLDCGELVDFFEFLKELLKDNWAAELDLEGGWRTLFLFGTFEKRIDVNFCLMNFVLSHARLAVVCRRNYAHFEGRKVKIKMLFKSIMKRDVNLMYKYGGEKAEHFFLSGSKLVFEGEGGEILFNW